MKMTPQELVEAHTREDWNVLWLEAMVWVRFVLRSFKRSEHTEDLEQEGALAAGEAVRTWKPERGAFSTHITCRVRVRLLAYLQGLDNAGIGAADRRFEGQIFDLDESTEDEDGMSTPQSEFLTYPDTGHVPQGYDTPEVELRRQTASKAVEALLGATEGAETLRAVGRYTGVSEMAVRRKVKKNRRKAERARDMFWQEPASTIRPAQTYREGT